MMTRIQGQPIDWEKHGNNLSTNHPIKGLIYIQVVDFYKTKIHPYQKCRYRKIEISSKKKYKQPKII